MPENRFVGDVARRYDETSASMFHPDVLGPAVDRLEEWAGGGPVLEFAVGTGRVALPLAERGVEVTGIELSADMLAELRAKPGGDAIRSVQGDMASTRVDGSFALVYLVFNTITNLTTQDEQVACVENAARHLRPGGRFVIENGVPALRRLVPGSAGVVFANDADHVGLDDFVDRTHRQLSHSRHLHRLPDGTYREFVAPFRYVWPSELDLMARIAGMTLEHRWADWHGAPFDGESARHVSVWRVPQG